MNPMADGPRTASHAQATRVGGGAPAAGAGGKVDPAVGSAQVAGSGVAGSTPSGAVSSASSSSSSAGRRGGRSTLDAHELAIVMSHYDVGVIEAIQEFPRGSRKAPKLILRADSGLYLLKRRARGKDDPFKVAFCHALQMRLAEKQFPLPHLIGTRRDNNSMLQWKGHTYELFEYIKGTPYDSSLEATADAGRILALFHKLLADYKPDYDPPKGSYHAARSVEASFQQLPRTVARTNEPLSTSEFERVDEAIQYLRVSYNDAAHRVVEMGLDEWPAQIVHSDWHPGNMLFRGPRVVAVIDYDAARMHQRIIDAANGALQFSIIGGGDDPAKWPEYLDESRFKRFIRGYDSVPDCVLSRAELRCIPWLMIEALVAEAVIPIAATGQFARMTGAGFLMMVEKKVRWLQDNADKLVNVLDS